MLRFDDQFPLHRKVDALSDSAFRLHVEAIFWCARHLTDGVVSNDDLDTVSRKVRGGKWTPELVRRECWHRFEGGWIIADCDECKDRYGPTLDGDGWVVHGYLDWQQMRSKVLQTREARKKAGRLGGQRSASARASRNGTSKPAGQAGSGSKPEANVQAGTPPVAQPHSPPPSTKGGGERARADAGRSALPQTDTARASPNGLPDFDAIERAAVRGDRRGALAATARAAVVKPAKRPSRRPDSLAELRAITPDAPVPPTTEPEEAPRDP